MYAVIRSGGKQYRVAEGERVRLGKLVADQGASVELDQVLAVHTGEELKVGAPLVAAAKVTARVIEHGRGRKIIVYRFKRRKGFHKTKGHRQDYTDVQITSITAG